MNVEDRIKVDGRFSADDVLLDRYRIVKLIGEGGFADVYEASDQQEGRQVALKVLHQVDGHKRQQVIRRRFVLEAELVAQIKHPDVVQLYDFGITEDGRLFISLELLRGQTLEEHLYRNGAMSPGRAVRLVARCLEALQAAHALGVVHRDLKPSNLFLDRTADGTERLRILDFGIAFMTDEVDNRMTRTGQINGTPQYLAPEYIQQQIVTKALDVYQLALILVEMCTGVQVVHDDNPYKCLMAHVSGHLDLPEELMSTDLGPVIRQALDLDHEKRYADAGAFRFALAPFLEVAAAVEIYSSEEDRRSAGARRTRKKSHHELPVQIEVTSPAPMSDRRAGLEQLAQQSRAKRSRSGRNRLFAVVGVVALFVGVGTYLTLTQVLGKDSEGDPATSADTPQGGAAVAAVIPPDADKTAPPTATVEAPKPDAATAPSKPEVPQEIEFAADAVGVAVDVVVNPVTAEIFRGPDSLGLGKATLVFDSEEAEAVELRVEGPGYETKLTKVGPADGPQIDIALKRARANARPKKKKRQTKKLKFFD